MKLVVNYDFFDYVRNLNNSDSKFVLLKHRTKYWLKIDLPICSVLNVAVFQSDIEEILSSLIMQYAFSLYLLNFDRFREHHYAIMKKELEDNKRELIALATMLQDLNISTNYQLLLQSELYHKESKIILNDLHLPDLLSKKYIYVPCYNYNGDIKQVSIEQDHIVGTKEYVLTLGFPKKQYSLSYSNT